MGLLVLLLLVPLNLLLRRRPEDMGLEPDGDRAITGSTAVHPSNVVDTAWAAVDWTLGRAARTARFWWIALGYFLGLFAWYAVQVHQTKYLIEIGFRPTDAAWALGVVSLAGIPGQIALGWLSDRIGREWVWTVGALGFAICYATLLLLADSPTPTLLYVMVVSQGMLGYGLTSVVGAIPAEIFQGRHYGSIFGTLMLSSIGGRRGRPVAHRRAARPHRQLRAGLPDRDRLQRGLGGGDLARSAPQGARGGRPPARAGLRGPCTSTAGFGPSLAASACGSRGPPWPGSSRCSWAPRGSPCSAGCWAACSRAIRSARLAGPVAGVAALIALRGLLEYGRAMVAHHTAARVQARLRATLYAQITALGPAHFTQTRTGDVILSVVEGVQQLEVYFGQYLPQLFVSALTPFLIFGFVAAIDLPLAGVLLAAALATFLLAPPSGTAGTAATASRARRPTTPTAPSSSTRSRGCGRWPPSARVARAPGCSRSAGHSLFQATMWLLGTNTLARGISDMCIALGAAVALGLGAHRVQAGSMDADRAGGGADARASRSSARSASCAWSSTRACSASPPPRASATCSPSSRRSGHRHARHDDASHSGIRRWARGRSDAAPPDQNNRFTADPPIEPSITFEHVTFAYPGGRRAALRDLAFQVAAGERVGVVGASGAGKSTISRLLLRFADPSAGRVTVGGHDLRELSLHDLRRLIAVVSQDTYLFHGTVEDNLRMGRPDATPGRARGRRAQRQHPRGDRGACRRATRRWWASAGVRLSGGQRQRIAIARALLRDAPILILDEALSSVDAESEAAIQEALDRLMRGRTTLIFAHRLSSIIGADRILVLDDGAVAESGTHATLMARDGVYRRLMAGQAGGGRRDEGLFDDAPAGAADDGAAPASGDPSSAGGEDAPAVLRAAGPGWREVGRILFGLASGYHARLVITFVLGVARVAALIGVGLLSALVVRAVSRGAPTRRAAGGAPDRGARPRGCSTGSSPGSRTTWPIACSRTCACASSASSWRWVRPICRRDAPAICSGWPPTTSS